MSRHRRHKSQKRKLRTGAKVAIILCSVIAALAVGVFVLYSQTLGKITYVDKEAVVPVPREQETFEVDNAEAEVPDSLKPEEVDYNIEEEELVMDDPIDGDVMNIMLIGQDRRSGQDRQRSDSMIICSINKKTNQITLTSLMRDLYVPIPGYSDNRLNATYVFGGMKLLDETVEQDFGVHIDGNIEVDFNGFMTAMGKIGTLEIDLKDYEVEYMKKQNANWNLQVGKNSLGSDQLLCYARMRYAGNADYERTERQRTVLMKAFNKMLASDVRTLISAATDILPALTTDMSPTDLIGLVYTVKSNNMKVGNNYRIPVDGTFSGEMIRGMSVLVPDLAANRAALKEYIYGES